MAAKSLRVVADDVWRDGLRGPHVLHFLGDTLHQVLPWHPREAGDIDGRIAGTVLPGFADAHVHLGLADAQALVAGGISHVLDLGWVPEVAACWRADGSPDRPAVRISGGFFTAPGGYPSTRSWCPPGAAIEISSPEQAAREVGVACARGVDVIKITLNQAAGPVFSDDLLKELVRLSHDAGLPAVVHAEGSGQAERAFAAGADALAHAPWTERLGDNLLRAMAGTLTWISTLAIHSGPDLEVALDNVRRFGAAGGRIRYGTDLGNGDAPAGINPRELALLADAGLTGDALIDSVVPVRTDGPARLCVIPGTRPRDSHDLVNWLTTGTVASVPVIKEMLR